LLAPDDLTMIYPIFPLLAYSKLVTNLPLKRIKKYEEAFAREIRKHEEAFGIKIRK
jgi:hypothetical protein